VLLKTSNTTATESTHFSSDPVDSAEEQTNSTWDKAGNILEKVGENIKTTSSQIFEKTSEIAENLTEKVVENSDKVWDQAAELAEKAGEKVKEGSEILWEKAKAAGAVIEEKFDATVEKAKAFEEEEKSKPKEEFASDDLNAGGSLLDNKDDFFAKAAQYADGHFDAFSEGKVVVNPNPESPDKKEDDKDIDGLIDDAIVVKD
jgi:hypothetical protein